MQGLRWFARIACASIAVGLVPLAAILAPGCGGGASGGRDGGPGGAGGSGGKSAGAMGGGGDDFIDAEPSTGAMGGGCSDASDEIPPPGEKGCEGVDAGGVSFQSDVVPIFALRCSGELCHVSPSYESTVGKPSSECCDRSIVAPFDPAHSYLVDKIEGARICYGGPMPLAKDPLSNEDVATIVRWICAGALND
jgi:hypothetical protein